MTNETYDRISKNVIKYRKEKNISQLELALKMGMKNKIFIFEAENRVNNAHFSIIDLLEISYILEIDILKFFE